MTNHVWLSQVLWRWVCVDGIRSLPCDMRLVVQHATKKVPSHVPWNCTTLSSCTPRSQCARRLGRDDRETTPGPPPSHLFFFFFGWIDEKKKTKKKKGRGEVSTFSGPYFAFFFFFFFILVASLVGEKERRTGGKRSTPCPIQPPEPRDGGGRPCAPANAPGMEEMNKSHPCSWNPML